MIHFCYLPSNLCFQFIQFSYIFLEYPGTPPPQYPDRILTVAAPNILPLSPTDQHYNLQVFIQQQFLHPRPSLPNGREGMEWNGAQPGKTQPLDVFLNMFLQVLLLAINISAKPLSDPGFSSPRRIATEGLGWLEILFYIEPDSPGVPPRISS